MLLSCYWTCCGWHSTGVGHAIKNVQHVQCNGLKLAIPTKAQIPASFQQHLDFNDEQKNPVHVFTSTLFPHIGPDPLGLFRATGKATHEEGKEVEDLQNFENFTETAGDHVYMPETEIKPWYPWWPLY